MKNIESTPSSLSNPLAGVRVYPELIAIEPWSTPDPEVRAYFEASRPDVYPILPPRDQLNPQAREALAVFDKADELRAEPGYETALKLADLQVKAAIGARRQQVAVERVKKEIKQGKIFSEDKVSKTAYYAEQSGWVRHEIEDQALLGGLPEGSPLYRSLQPGSSALGRLTILERLGFNEKNIKGSIALQGLNNYNMKSYGKVLGSERFFGMPDDDDRELWLARILYDAKHVITKRRQARERKRKRDIIDERKRKIAAADAKMFEDNIEGAVRQIEARAESLQQDGYMLSSTANLEPSREKVELVKGSLAELRQVFPDLHHPGVLNVLDDLVENFGADAADKIAVLVGAHVLETGKVCALGSDLATVYRKSDSPEDRP